MNEFKGPILDDSLFAMLLTIFQIFFGDSSLSSLLLPMEFRLSVFACSEKTSEIAFYGILHVLGQSIF